MAHSKVLHVERGFWMSKNYAEQVMRDHCSITWDIPYKTIRDTTDEERIAMRAQQAESARRAEPLALAELHGLVFQPPVSGISATRRGSKLTWEAHKFAAEAA